jgi:hypothetical protein
MKINNIFFLCLVTITLFFDNKTYTMSGGGQFFGLFAAVLVSGVVIYRSNAGPKVVEVGASSLLQGVGQAVALPTAKAIGNILQIPFVNPVDQEINDLIEERKSLASKVSTLQQTTNTLQQLASQPAAQIVGKKDPLKAQQTKTENLTQGTVQQQLKVEKEITKLTEKKVFDQKKSNLIFL